MPVQALCTVAEAVKLNAFAFSLTLDVGEELAGQVACGQFIHIKCGHSRLLRRPISVCDWMGDTLRVVFEVLGEGTECWCHSHASRLGRRPDEFLGIPHNCNVFQ